MIDAPWLRLHHFGLAARDPDAALVVLRGLGYVCGTPVHDALQGVTLHWCEKAGSPAVEVVSAAGDGPLAAVLAAQGSSFYHLCYEIGRTAEEACAELAERGVRIVTVRAPLPAVLFGGRLVSFHFARGLGLLEFLQPASGEGGSAGQHAP